MAKLIVALLVIVALAFGIYFSIFGKIPSLSKLALNDSPVKNPVNSFESKITPTPDTSDQALELDLTALERDLADIEKDNTSFTQELNSL